MFTGSMFKILGCGHSESLEHFNNNAAVLSEAGNLLIDCGHTVKHALYAQDLSISDIDAIYISHVHGDHVFGLERVAYEALFKYKKRIKLFFHHSLYRELWHETLKGSLGLLGEGPAALEDYFEVYQLDRLEFEIFGNYYQLLPVKHTPGKPAFGLLINNDILYTTDTTAIPELIECLDFRVGFHDVTFTAENPVHATLESLLKWYPSSIRQKLYLMSYEDTWRKFEDKVKQDFRGLAAQGMEFELHDR
ncbi:MAG: MBL fold metallo-hydrolase [Pseudohongiella sp.]|uniref:MBL fold metallo-hydrolase n=1 Tax=Pseudohongiella sp. TaxID=1979412 RepID=UPI00349FED22